MNRRIIVGVVLVIIIAILMITKCSKDTIYEPNTSIVNLTNMTMPTVINETDNSHWEAVNDSSEIETNESNTRNISITPLNKKLQPHTRKSCYKSPYIPDSQVPEFSYMTLLCCLIATTMGVYVLKGK